MKQASGATYQMATWQDLCAISLRFLHLSWQLGNALEPSSRSAVLRSGWCQEATEPYQFALKREPRRTAWPLLRAATELDPAATVVSLDGRSAYNSVSRAAFLNNGQTHLWQYGRGQGQVRDAEGEGNRVKWGDVEVDKVDLGKATDGATQGLKNTRWEQWPGGGGHLRSNQKARLGANSQKGCGLARSCCILMAPGLISSSCPKCFTAT